MSTTATPSTLENAAQPHLPVSRILGYACGDAGCNIAFQMTGLFLLIFYTDVVGINPMHAGNIFLFVKIWDALADLFAGRMVDRTMTRWGKFRPFLLWYSVPLLLSNLLCFWIPVDGYGAKLAWATVSYALMGLLYSLVNIPYGSLAGAMSQNPIDRSRLASGRMVGSGATILLLALVLAPQIKASQNLALTFLLTAAAFVVIGTVLFTIVFVTARETVVREVAQVSLKQTLQTVTKNGPLARLCLSSFFYLTGQNVISALGIYIANTILSRYVGGNWLATVVTIITTGAVIYVGPFGPLVTRTLGKKRGFILAASGRPRGLRVVLRQRQPHLRPHRAVLPRCRNGPAEHHDLGAGGRHRRVRRVQDRHPHRGRHLRRVLLHPQGRPGRRRGHRRVRAGLGGLQRGVEGHRHAAGPPRCWTGCSRPPGSAVASCFLVAMLDHGHLPAHRGAGSARSWRASRPTGLSSTGWTPTNNQGGALMTSAQDVLASLGSTTSWQEDFYKHLHAHPELSSQESRTAAADSPTPLRLRVRGSVHRRWGRRRSGARHGQDGAHAGGHGCAAGRGHDGSALRSTETAVDADGAQVAVMHACGHDVHVACCSARRS